MARGRAAVPLRLLPILPIFAQAQNLWTSQFYYFTQGTSVPRDMDARTPDLSRTDQVLYFNNPISNAAWSGVATAFNFAARFASTLVVTVKGNYTFKVTSDEGVRLLVGDVSYIATPLIDDSYAHAAQQRTAIMALQVGSYPVQVEYFQATGNSQLLVEYSGADTSGWKKLCDSTNAVKCTTRTPNAAPVLSVSGGSPYYVGVGTAWAEPGVWCSDAEDGMITVQYTPPDTSVAQNVTVVYTCTDSSKYSVSQSRLVVIKLKPVITLNGPPVVTIMIGETFNDGQACCVDTAGNSLPITIFGQASLNKNVAGAYTLTYQCSDPNTGASDKVDRTVIVDGQAAVAVMGSASTKTVKGFAYADPGMLCVDVEDGTLMRRKSNVKELLQVVKTFTSASTSTTYSLMDTRYTSTCSGTVSMPSGWIKFDLGTIRVVYFLKIYNPCAGCAIHVGNEGSPTATPPTTGSCTMSTPLSAATGWVTVNCLAPQAGRYVSIYPPSGSFSIAEVEIWGTAGPGLPGSFSVSSCPWGAYSFIVSGVSSDFPTYADKSTLDGTAALATLSYDKVNLQWSLKNSGGTVMASAPSSGALVGLTWTGNSGAGYGSCVPAFTYKVEDACTWLFGFSKTPGMYQCPDGTSCAGDGCCGTTPAFCPPEKPLMCATTDFFGKYICSTDCSASGGLRPCRDSLNGITDCWSVSAKYTPTFGNTFTEADETACQYRCRTTVGCTYWTYQLNTATFNCKLSATGATRSTVFGFTAGPKTCIPRQDLVGAIDTDTPGIQNLVYTCTDIMGQFKGVSRLVEVACEGPNPTGTYGGNRVTCEQTYLVTLSVANQNVCSKQCLADATCEAYEFDQGTCKRFSFCDGRYYRDDSATRQVGYCQRKDHAPKVVLGISACCFAVGTTWPEGSYSCTDLEDPIPPVPVKVTDLNPNVPGVYTVTYICTDRARQSTNASRTVTVKANCAVPAGIANVAAAGPCAEGNNPIPWGKTCTSRCMGGSVPTKVSLLCTTTSDLDFNSNWNALFACGDQPCNQPSVAYVASDETTQIPKSCKEASLVNGTYVVPSGGYCIPNCYAVGWRQYVANETRLRCNRGAFEPPTYRCRLPAAVPEYILFGKPNAEDVDVNWSPGASNDCIFRAWTLMVRRVDTGFLTDWGYNAGCLNLGVNGRSIDIACNARNFTEGAMYQFRVREECTEVDMNSQWQVSQNVTMRVVLPPEVIFSLPMQDVTASPGQFLIAYSVSCVRSTKFAYANLNVTRYGDFCPTQSLIVPAPALWANGLPGPGYENAPNYVELTGQRIIIVTPTADFLDTGCTFNVTLERGLIQTYEEPAKPSPFMNWNFTYIDVRPVLQVFAIKSKTKDTVNLMVLFTLLTIFNCTAYPTSITSCYADANASTSPTRGLKCLNVTSDYNIFQSVADFTYPKITGLYPGTDYSVDCSGYKFYGRPKWWVKTMPTPSTLLGQINFQTDEDTDKTIGVFNVNVTVLCDDGRVIVTRQYNIRPSDLDLGVTVQIVDWKMNCIGGAELVAGQVVAMNVTGYVVPTSQHATLTWMAPRGPVVGFVYTKPPNGGNYVMKDYFLFRICPLAWNKIPNQYPCTDYKLNLQTVDVTFSFSKLNFGGMGGNGAGSLQGLRRLTGGEDLSSNKSRLQTNASDIEWSIETGLTDIAVSEPEVPHEVLGVYRRLQAPAIQTGVLQNSRRTINIYVSQSTFDWSQVSVSLGSTTEGFKLPMAPNNGVLDFALVGQGTDLPLLLIWKGAAFNTNNYISFAPPQIVLPATEAAICCPPNDRTVLRFNFQQVPDMPALQNLTNPVWGGGFSNPSTYIQMVVTKRGRNENLCQGTSFVKNTDGNYSWTQAWCSLAPGALTDLVLRLQILNYSTRLLQIDNNSAVTGMLTYARPTINGMHDGGIGATNSKGVIDLGMVTKRTLYLIGIGLPRTRDLEMRGAAMPGYKAELVSDSSRLDFCESIDSVDFTNLSCVVRRCLNVSAAVRLPSLMLYLGDLSSKDPVSNVVVLPKPYVTDFGPKTILDVGYNQTMWFKGKFFGGTTCLDNSTDAIQLIGAPTGAVIKVGEYKALCTVVWQNSTYVVCYTQSQVMYPRVLDPAGGLPTLRRISQQPITFSVGALLPALNGQTLTGEYPSEPTEAIPDLVVSVTLSECPAGMRRAAEDVPECVPCSLGRWITPDQAEWPLRCNACPEGTYQDQEGATACKACPANTETRQGADAQTDCVCKPGYYSPLLNVTTGTTVAGTACIACHASDMTQEPVRLEKCGDEIMVSQRCDVFSVSSCVNEAPPAVSFRLCKAYCPGGTTWPKAKSSFWLRENRAVGTGDNGLTKYMPVIVRCDPLEACTPHNTCLKMYSGEACSFCIFGYWRDAATNICMPCGAEQVFGMIMMSAMAVILSVGGLFGATTFIRLQADIQFKQLAMQALVKYVIEPIKKSSAIMKISSKTEVRKTVTLTTSEVGKSYTYAKKGDLGMVFRVDDSSVIHLAGLLPDSPLVGKAVRGWRLQTVNGKRLNLKTEAEVQAVIKAAKFPMRLTFLASRKTKAQQEQEEKGLGATVDLSDDRKMLILMIGVMNSFNQVSMFDFDWPPIFKKLAALAAQFSFNFNFFHPECSVAVPFIKKWLYFLSVPYVMMVPLTTAFLIACGVTLYKDVTPDRQSAFWTKSWLLKNAYARVCCMSCILLLPFHYEQLLIPFACVQRGLDTYFVAAMPETECSLKDETYRTMLQISATGTCFVGLLYAFILTCLWKSFNWQFGSRCRDYIPFYVAMVEVSTFGQRGYVGEVRARVMSNICAAKTYDPGVDMLAKRELAVSAVEYMKMRKRGGWREKKLGGQAIAQGVPQEPKELSLTSGDRVKERLDIIKGRRTFLAKQTWPERPDGNVMTYGWVLIVNLAWRQIASLMTIKLTKGNMVVVGAAAQMVIFAVNITLLMCFQPYKSARITNTESIMLTALFSILWCAVMKDLLVNNIHAAEYTTIIARVSRGIEILAIFLIILVVIVPMYQVILMGTRFLVLFSGPDAVLNDIYFTQRMRAVKEKAKAERNKIADLMDPDAAENAVEDLASVLSKNLPTLDEALRRFTEMGKGKDVDELEQRRLLTRLGRMVMQAEQSRQRQLEQRLAQEALEEELKREAKRREEEEAKKKAKGLAGLFGRGGDKKQAEESTAADSGAAAAEPTDALLAHQATALEAVLEAGLTLAAEEAEAVPPPADVV